MDTADQVRLVLQNLLAEQRTALPRPAVQFLDALLADESVLSRMQFCRPAERHQLRNSVLIATVDSPCWGVMLGNETGAGPGAAAQRTRLALEGLELTPGDVLERLRPLPVWFLALDPPYADPTPGEAVRLEHTVYALVSMQSSHLRRLALMDQIDAALEAHDKESYERLRQLLDPPETPS